MSGQSVPTHFTKAAISHKKAMTNHDSRVPSRMKFALDAINAEVGSMASLLLRIKNGLLVGWMVVVLVGCGDPKERPLREADLLSPSIITAWETAAIPDQGAVDVAVDGLRIQSGKPMSGVRFSAWRSPRFPLTNYAIDYEAMRVEGRDIFGMVTFPVGDEETHATFVLGGWGGTVTGISSIDFSDANENQTRGEHPFENDHWYRVRIEVRTGDLRAWIDGKIVVNVSIKGRHVGLRQGYVDHCLPFGFATYGSAAVIRAVAMTRLSPEL